jgi:diguanylate cyclase (GGDEF)-like protein
VKLLAVGAPVGLGDSRWGPFELIACADLDAVAARLHDGAPDALLLAVDAATLAAWPALSQAVLDAAVVALVPKLTPEAAERLLALGVQDILPADVDAGAAGRALRLAAQRKAIERVARKAYATDLATGLPNHAQLLEHMTHLVALREREPAPMALIALRIEGLATAQARLGTEAANVLRRKAAVRLRAALRASDVVAAAGNDTFAVLLAWIDAPGDGERVAAKLVQALHRPFNVAGEALAVAVAAGLASYPEHGKDADTLLRRAIGQAADVTALGREGFANVVERGPASAANDDG